MMVLEAKVMLKLFAAANVYRHTATIQQADNVLMVWCWKQVIGTYRRDPTAMVVSGSDARSTHGKWP